MNLSQSDRTFMKHFAIMIVMLAGFAVAFTIIGTLVWASLPHLEGKAQVRRAGTRITPVAAVRTSANALPAASGGPSASAATGSGGKTAAANGPYKYDATKGKQLFTANCAVCHQASGTGIAHTFPPLKGNPAVDNADPAVQIETILHGKHGVLIAGKKYSGVMTPFASQLSNTEIATIANYERSSWGNHAKHVTPKDVAEIRAKSK